MSAPSPTRTTTTGTGKVTLVGGGPGAGDLMTVRAVDRLRAADVVVHDRLSPTEVLEGLTAEIINVGKRPGFHPVPQERINELIVDRALQGLHVVRLKGGDPFMFGRGGEEALACGAAGIPVEVVPGITSAISAPEAAGVPVTHRGTADAVHIVNGTHLPGDATLAALKDPSVTVVLLMGVGFFPRFAEAALAAGTPESSPVAFIESAYSRGQRTSTTTLAEATGAMHEIGVRSPAVIVIGDVAAMAGMTTPEGTATLAALGSSA